MDRVRFPGGSEGTLEFIQHAGASAVVPFLDPPTDHDPRILLVHQYRYAASGYIFEVPAGMPDGPEESWEAGAHRELEEETGHRAGDLRYLASLYTTPGFTDEVIHLFAASELEAGAANRDQDEFMEVRALPFSEAIRMVRDGRIVDAKSMVALLFAHAFLPEVWDEPRTAPHRAP